MGDSIQLDRIAERFDDVILPDDVFKPLGAVASGDNGIVLKGRPAGALAAWPGLAQGQEARSVGPLGRGAKALAGDRSRPDRAARRVLSNQRNRELGEPGRFSPGT